MKAIRVHQFGGPEVMGLGEVPDVIAGPGEVVVRVYAVGVNPVDGYIRTGTYRVTPSLPYTPGSDAAGVVEAVGQGVSRLRVGDRVYTAGTISGAYAARALCRESQVHPLARQVSFFQGAAIHIPYATAYRALFQRAQALPGEIVLVHGASGGVGVAAVQLARAAGLRVFGTAGTDRGRELVAREGAHQVLDHKTADYLEQGVRQTGGRGFDVILEMLANVNLGKDLGVLAPGGRVVVIGSRGTVEINPRDTISQESSILGMLLLNTPPSDALQIHAALGSGLESGTLRPIVRCELPLEDAPRAHKMVMEPGAYGKIVLVP